MYDGQSLTKAISEAPANSTINVNAGTYDIIKETKEKYGNDFFDNFKAGDYYGIILGNNKTVVCSSNANIICDYTGTNTAVQNLFSPFNSGVGGFTLINAHVWSKHVRYTMHDERGTENDSYTNKYIDCVFTHEYKNSNSFPQCIGGGLGVNGHIHIENCTFYSVDNGNDGSTVSYHNSASSNAKSNIVITGCNFKSGTVTIRSYGSSTKKTTALISNNRVKSIPTTFKETSDSTENIELVQWNNVVY